MLDKTKWFRWLIVSISALTLLSFAIYLFVIFNIAMPSGRDYIRAVTLYHVDHPKLLQICRRMIKVANSGEETSSVDDLRALGLKPREIDIVDDCVSLNLGYGISIYAYSEGSKGLNTASADAGFIELIDGLWYYDSALVDNPEYIKVLERLKDRDIEELKKPPWYDVD